MTDTSTAKGIAPAHYVCLALCFTWALFVTLSKHVIDAKLASTTGIASLQRFIASLGLLVAYLFLPREKRRVPPGQWRYLIVIGFVHTLFTYTTYWAFRRYDTTVANSAVLLRSDLIFCIVFGRFLLNERLRAPQYVCLAGMVVGLFLVTSVSIVEFEVRWIGDALIVLTALLVTCNAFIIRIALARCDNRTIALHNNTLSLFMILGVYLVLQVTDGTILQDVASFQAHPELLVAIVCLGLCNAAVFLLYYYCLYKLPVWEVRAFMLFVPFFAALMAWLAPSLKEALSAGQIAGMILMAVFGVCLAVQSGPGPEREAPR